MSVTGLIPDEHGIAHTALGHECFFCGQALSDPAVHWMGHGWEIYLHAACVLDLFMRLARDVHEIQNPEYYVRLRKGARREGASSSS